MSTIPLFRTAGDWVLSHADWRWSQLTLAALGAVGKVVCHWGVMAQMSEGMYGMDG